MKRRGDKPEFLDRARQARKKLVRDYVWSLHWRAVYSLNELEAVEACLELRELALWLRDEGILSVLLAQLSDKELAGAGVKKLK
jgi:hypothetical protein